MSLEFHRLPFSRKRMNEGRQEDEEEEEEPRYSRKRFRLVATTTSKEEWDDSVMDDSTLSDDWMTQTRNILECIHLNNTRYHFVDTDDEEWEEAIVILHNHQRYFTTMDQSVYNEDLEYVGTYDPTDQMIRFIR